MGNPQGLDGRETARLRLRFGRRCHRLDRDAIEPGHQPLLTLKLLAPMGCHLQQAIEIKTHPLSW